MVANLACRLVAVHFLNAESSFLPQPTHYNSVKTTMNQERADRGGALAKSNGKMLGHHERNLPVDIVCEVADALLHLSPQLRSIPQLTSHHSCLHTADPKLKQHFFTAMMVNSMGLSLGPPWQRPVSAVAKSSYGLKRPALS